MKFSHKQRLFIQEYLIDLNATKAAIRAGYSKQTAYSQGQRMLKNVEIKREIDEAMEKRGEKVGIGAEWVLENLQTVVERCMQKKKSKDGREWRFNASGAIRALDLLAKHVGFYDKDNEQKKDTLKWSDVSHLSDEEKRKILEREVSM